jgi:DNA helicase-2/ATP-dependent DNA helicase PcrA
MFPGAKVVKLEQNYRSTKTILAAANTVIANNKQRHGKSLWSQMGDGEIITHAVAATPEDEAKFVAKEIHQLHADGRGWDSMAVMYRSNLQAKIIEEELRAASIPYVMYGGQQFFERKEVKDVLAYLRVALNPKDELALRRIINYPARGLGATTVERLVLAAQAKHASLWDACKSAVTGTGTLPGMNTTLSSDDDGGPGLVVDVGDLRGAARNGILELIHVISELASAIESGMDPVSATKVLVEDIKLYDDLRMASGSMAAAQRRIDNVEGLYGSLQRFAERGKGKEDLAEYLRMLSLETSKEEDQIPGPKVVLTTLHGAKGLEFPVCFMIGLEEELLPHIRTLQPQATDALDADHATDISEERRLCYVGITRAQRKLYLTRACTRVARGRSVPRTPSRFLLEIPEELYEVRDIGEEARQKVPEAEVQSFFGNLANMLDD